MTVKFETDTAYKVMCALYCGLLMGEFKRVYDEYVAVIEAYQNLAPHEARERAYKNVRFGAGYFLPEFGAQLLRALTEATKEEQVL